MCKVPFRGLLLHSSRRWNMLPCARPTPSFLDGQKALSFRQAPYIYEIVRNGDVVLESVGDGRSSISQPLLLAFGKGIVGQTYIYEVDGNLFETRVSYYTAFKGLDLTTGHLPLPPPASNVPWDVPSGPEAQKCFGCHTTASTTANRFDPNQSLEGVTCEACHGPGSRHVQAMKTGQIERGKKIILNPTSLDAASSVDFCGACHRTTQDVLEMNVSGVATVRFQPFRLQQSRCWSRANGQLTVSPVTTRIDPWFMAPPPTIRSVCAVIRKAQARAGTRAAAHSPAA